MGSHADKSIFSNSALRYWWLIIAAERAYCGAREASEQQPNQDLRTIYRREFITFYQNALHLTRMHCAAPLFTRVHFTTNNTEMSRRLFAWIPVRKFSGYVLL